MKANPVGFHTSLTPERYDAIIEATPHILFINRIADYCCVPRSSLKTWMKRGNEDAEAGIDSIFAQLSTNMARLKAERMRELLKQVEYMPDNYRALTWMLEKCFREEFGNDSEEMRELRIMFEHLILGKGNIANDKELDSEGSAE